jgi:hypothetical protein
MAGTVPLLGACPALAVAETKTRHQKETPVWRAPAAVVAGIRQGRDTWARLALRRTVRRHHVLSKLGLDRGQDYSETAWNKSFLLILALQIQS